jgi:hypothetical protein
VGKRLTYKGLYSMSEPRTPKTLDAIVDKVLAYKPKPKTKLARKRKKRAAKIAKKVRCEYDNGGSA